MAKPEMNIQVDTGEEGTEQAHQPESAEDGGQATEMIVSDTQGMWIVCSGIVNFLSWNFHGKCMDLVDVQMHFCLPFRSSS